MYTTEIIVLSKTKLVYINETVKSLELIFICLFICTMIICQELVRLF